MANRRQNPRLAKSLLSYTILEVAELYDVHRNTVRHWIAAGLRQLDHKKPVMIHGSELNRFHKARRLADGRHCGPGEVYCLSCREPRRPAGDIADYTPLNEKIGTLSAICPDCERIMTQRVNAERLARFEFVLEVTVRPAPEPIKRSV